MNFKTQIDAANRKLERLRDDLILASQKDKKDVQAEITKTLNQLAQIKTAQSEALKAEAQAMCDGEIAQAIQGDAEIKGLLSELEKSHNEIVEGLKTVGDIFARRESTEQKLLEVARKQGILEAITVAIGSRGGAYDLLSGACTTAGLDLITRRWDAPQKREAKQGLLPFTKVKHIFKEWCASGNSLSDRRLEAIKRSAAEKLALEVRKASGWSEESNGAA